MNKSKKTTTEDTPMNPEDAAGQSRRDFLKTAGKFAVYTPPAVMMLMKPGYARMNKSMTGRPHRGQGGQGHHHGGNNDGGYRHGGGKGRYGRPS